MSSTIGELLARAREHRQNNNLEEALASALAAADQAPFDTEAWWQVALARIALLDRRKAIEALKKVLEIDATLDNVWARLGEQQLELKSKDEAKSAFVKSLELNSANLISLEGLSRIYRADDLMDDYDAEISILQQIESSSFLDGNDIIRLGYLFYQKDEYQAAATAWAKNDEYKTNAGLRFNLGLAFRQPKIGRMTDAIDLWRTTLRETPSYEAPVKSLNSLLPEMLELASEVQKQNFRLPSDESYVVYLNPFLLLNASGLELKDFDPKTTQKLKKAMLQELELEEGKLAWLPDLKIDRSRAMGLVDEISNETLREYHWTVYKDTPLLEFLSFGKLEHFLVSENELERFEIIEKIEKDKDFLEWVGKYFAIQYDRTLVKIIETDNQLLLKTIKCGRRWVPVFLDDQCFFTTRRLIENLTEPLRELAEASAKEKIEYDTIANMSGRVVGALNTIPIYLDDLQNMFAETLRELYLNAYNKHEDVYLAKRIAEILDRLLYKSNEISKRLNADVVQLLDIITREEAKESRLKISGEEFSITRAGVREGALFFEAATLASVKLGKIVSTEGYQQKCDFLFSVKNNKGEQITVQWKTGTNLEEQHKLFNGIVDAAFEFVLPPITSNMREKLSRGLEVRIGTCTLTNDLVRYNVSGWFFDKIHEVKISATKSTFENGNIIVYDNASPKKRTVMDLRTTDNAFILPALLVANNSGD